MLFVPSLFPFTVHWYLGDAPIFNGDAVKVTCVPWQTWLAEALIHTLTVNEVPTIILTRFEMAGLPLTQPEFDVR